MQELKKLYGLVEFLFYFFWFSFFLMWILIRNNFYIEITNTFFKFSDFPFIIIAIIYWLLSIKFQYMKENWENKNYGILDAWLVLIWVSAMSIILFLQFAYPDII